ncbi:MAG: hypothetical protein QGH51_03075 [Planctomycetota bacterium]|jgi:tetratricopeptide (TPR) repeat protein|nr:hypothetical protein [Planctomycetota bacterium]MDP6940987.1 hypothetical protein [Planctomycetota bacterium]
MRFGFLTIPLLLFASCQSTSWVGVGDSAFAVGDYQAALIAYEKAAAAGEGTETPLQGRISEARARILPEYARKLIHQEKHLEALEILAVADQMTPGHPLSVELRARAYRGMAAELATEADSLRGMGQIKAAHTAFSRALDWDSNNRLAQKGCAELEEKLEILHRQGESFYFEGLRQRADGYKVRAHTAFMHAAAIWGEGSQAEAILKESSDDMAKEQVQQAHNLMNAGLLGPAWLALRDANRLQPGVPETESFLADLEARLKHRSIMNDADIQIRGERLGLAGELLETATVLGIEDKTDQVNALSIAMQEKQALVDYRMARACELAEQWERAAVLYQRVMDSDYGAEDIRWRLEKVRSHLNADT